jgi:hypothetical protein
MKKFALMLIVAAVIRMTVSPALASARASPSMRCSILP